MTRHNSNLDKIIYSFFPFWILASYIILIIEAFTYKGFFQKYLHVNSGPVLIISSMISFLFLVSGVSNFHKKSIDKLLFKINSILLPVFVTFYLIIMAAETANYQNYVFTTIHIIPDNFVKVVNLSILVQLVYFLKNKFKLSHSVSNFLKMSCNEKVRYLTIMTTIVALINYGVNSGSQTLLQATLSTAEIVNNWNSSYGEKMEKSWNGFYTYMTMVKVLTPEDAVILHPPQQNPWQEEGNQLLIRYFLYPRTLISANYEYDLKKDNVQYVLLARGSDRYPPAEGSYGWPKFDLDSKRIYYFNLDKKSFTFEEGFFDADDSRNMDSWGLIQL